MANGIDLAGGYGAGGAVRGLQDVLAQRFAERQFEEEKRAMRAREQQQEAALAQALALAMARMEQDESQFGRTLQDRLAGREFEAGESQKTRGHQTSERLGRQTFESGQLGQRQTFEKEEGERERTARASEGEKNRQTQLKVAGIYGARQGGDERTVQVRYTDPETGEEVVEYMTAAEARERGKLRAPAGRGQPQLKEKLADLSEAERLASAVLERGRRIGWRGTGPISGRVTGGLATAGVRVNEEEEALRNDLANLFSLISHERFGAALTAQELTRAKGFLAEKTDPGQRIDQKMESLLEFVRSKKASMGGPAGRAGAPGATANEDRIRQLIEKYRTP